ncbi:unnamed protein product [Boreogadus saida]
MMADVRSENRGHIVSSGPIETVDDCAPNVNTICSAPALQQSGVTPADRLGLSRLSPAELLVRELQSHGDRGRRLQDVLERGEPVPEVGG